MAAVTIRNLSDEAHRALKRRAAQHKRSTEVQTIYGLAGWQWVLAGTTIIMLLLAN